MKFIILSQGWTGTPFYGGAIAYQLQREGYDVTFGYAEKDINGQKKENCSPFDGMVKKYPIEKLVSVLSKVKNKDEYFIFCDNNELYPYAEKLVNDGFKNGLFPTKADYTFEKSRELAMEFVKKNYKDIKLIPFTEVSKVDDAVKFINENEGVFVIQSKGDHVSTFVPQVEDPQTAKEQTIGQIEKHRKDYEKGGIIIKTKLINPVEITPEIVFYNGIPVFTDLDIETKNIGEGVNNGHQVGCGSNLIISTEMGEKVNKIAFPPIVYEMAKKHTGMFVWDISIYLHEGSLYFGEFCPNRMGYDAAYTEMDMAGGAGKFFESVVSGKNPLKSKFGAAIRMFDLRQKPDHQIFDVGIEKHSWILEGRMKDGDVVCTTYECSDLAVLTASGDSIDDAVKSLYEYKDKFSFKEVYAKTKTDFMADFHTSIMHRYNAINHKFIEAPDTKEVSELRGQLEKEYKSKMEDEIGNIKRMLKEALYG